MIVRVVGLCVAAAMACAVLRTQRPELATAVSLAAGVAALAMVMREMDAARPQIEELWSLFAQTDSDVREAVLKAAGVALIAELGSELCLDGGERALAGRILLAARLAGLALCVPLLSRIVQALDAVL